jgi:hypothetical protein
VQKRTRKRVRDFRLSPLGQVGADGKPRNPRKVALEGFKRLNEMHYPQLLPDEAPAELNRILTAEREVEGMG